MPSPPGDTREQIQAIAVELFTEQGFEKTNLRQIAERLDMTKAAIYYHFNSKADLIRSIVNPLMEDFDALLRKARTADEVVPRDLLGDCFDLVNRHRTVYTALMRDASAFAHVDLEQRAVTWIDDIQAALVGPDGDTHRRVRAIVAFTGLTRAATMPAFTAMTAEEIRESALDAAVDALGNSAA